MNGLYILVAGLTILIILMVILITFLLLQLKKSGIKPVSDEEALLKANQIAKNKLLEAENKALEITSKAQNEARKIKDELRVQEEELNKRERKLLERLKSIDQRFDELERKEKSLEQAKKDVKALRSKLQTELEEIAKLTKSEAEKQLKNQIEQELSDWKAKKIKETKDLIERESDETAKNILVDVMLNSATDYVAETTTTTLTIEDENLKGKIIGKDGRNVRAFEKLTGVDVIIDEAPNQVTLSSFDPIRREVASLAMQKLLKDGRVHPGTIEETVNKVKKEVLKEIKKTGEEMAYETGFNNLPNEIIMLLGRFKYRFSYGQNLVKHTLEMVKIGEALANELNADVRTVKLACLLHDIGKVAPEEGKQHHHISGEIARKYFKNDEKLINAIEAHHFDIEAKSIEAEIVRIADAISGARPGARRDSYEEYVKRVRALEDIALKHKGVAEAFAIHAGREVRVIVKPEELNDKDTELLAYEIAKEIEETQSYPGVVKVNVIRELRVTTEAK
ncbi:MAG: ribonuclease Y [Candidatus Dojkabacteria bacterium]|nr:MAG: ribonuclease Y [Candidatus Dojkabacteria bacterium]